MRKVKRVCVLFLVFMFLVMLAACSKSYDKASTSSGTYNKSNGKGEVHYSMDDLNASFALDGAYAEAPADSIQEDIAKPQSMEKIIRRIRMEVETQEFDSLVNSIDGKINQLNGYIETSNISGRRYNSNNNRYAYIVARIPKSTLDEFVNNVNDIANVINKEETTENVTLEYIDTQSRKKSLEIEQERLFVLMEKADNLENIITLESRLSNIRYELQRYETQLRTFDNLVDYSTVTLNIHEVDRMSPSVSEEKTVWKRISTGFGETLYDLSEGFKNFMVWFVVNLPYLVIWGGIIAIVLILIRKHRTKKLLKKVSMPSEVENTSEK